MKTLQNLAALLVVLSVTSLSTHAVTITGVNSGSGALGAETTYDGNISNSDLLTSATITSNGVAPDLGSYTGINDGAANPGSDVSHNLYFGNGIAGTNLTLDPVITFTLNTSINTQGYTLSSVNSIYGWQNFETMTDQNYTISYTTVSNPTFTLLASVDYQPFDLATQNQEGDPNDHAATQVTLTDLGNISGVNAIQFAFSPAVIAGQGTQTGQMIREIDVFGAPTTAPEPSTWAMMVGGLTVLGYFIRRKGALHN